MAYFWRGLSTEGNLRFKIDWASLLVGRKFTIFALLYFVFEGNFPSTSPRGLYIWRGDILRRVFCVPSLRGLYLEGLIYGGAYFRNFRVFLCIPVYRFLSQRKKQVVIEQTLIS